ncbi:hypothetical protein AGLY_017423 [Aphis glycines]|uniref:DUF4371 domain-containing protein n=1 Tax=Aphis glycines TaxID=307491 RepID=A0A6G0SUX5_APHGL|nr:hypothetical protein AGLY_017423 [Aphis glycines]
MANSRKSLIRTSVRLLCAQKSKELQIILKQLKNKKTRRWWVRKWISRRDTLGASERLLKEFSTEDVDSYRNHLRLSKDQFEVLLYRISTKIQRQDTVMRAAFRDSSADEPLSDDLNSTKKRVKRKQCFKDDWIESHKWVGNSGIAAIKQHEISKKHKSSQSSLLKNKTMDFYGFKGPTADKEENQVIACELVQIYHTIKHNLSYNSLDCCIKVEKKIYKDLKMLNKLHLGRTKAESIVTEVLGPAYLHKIIDYLSSESVIAFSIQTDASNKKTVKLFPLSVQYFSIENGIENKLIDFYENPHETADEMSSYIKKSLENLKLSLHKVSALSADNTNCNFGKNHSLYTNLKKEIPNLIKANCHAHIIHNSVRHAMNFISFDRENVILKIYAHFSQFSVRRETLKDFFTFLNCEWSELKKHVVTRWLSLHPAIEIILKNWEPIKS